MQASDRDTSCQARAVLATRRPPMCARLCQRHKLPASSPNQAHTSTVPHSPPICARSCTQTQPQWAASTHRDRSVRGRCAAGSLPCCSFCWWGGGFPQRSTWAAARARGLCLPPLAAGCCGACASGCVGRYSVQLCNSVCVSLAPPHSCHLKCMLLRLPPAWRPSCASSAVVWHRQRDETGTVLTGKLSAMPS